MKPSTMLKIIAVSISMAILTACASTGSHSNPKVGTPEQSHDYLQSKPLQTLLKSSLNPQAYAGFNANLKQFSAPFALKEQSTMRLGTITLVQHQRLRKTKFRRVTHPNQ